MSDVDLFVVQQHTVDSLDSRLGRFGGVVVNETITFGTPTFVCRNLARKNVAKGSEGIVECLE